MRNFDTNADYVVRTIEDQLKILDTLPPTVRRALTYAAFPLDEIGVQRLLRELCEAEVIKRIQETERKYIKHEALRLYGPTHPQAALVNVRRKA